MLDQYFSRYTLMFSDGWANELTPTLEFSTWKEVEEILAKSRADREPKPWVFYAPSAMLEAFTREHFTMTREGDLLHFTWGNLKTTKPIVVDDCHDLEEGGFSIGTPDGDVDLKPNEESKFSTWITLDEEPSEEQCLQIGVDEFLNGCQHKAIDSREKAYRDNNVWDEP